MQVFSGCGHTVHEDAPNKVHVCCSAHSTQTLANQIQSTVTVPSYESCPVHGSDPLCHLNHSVDTRDRVGCLYPQPCIHCFTFIVLQVAETVSNFLIRHKFADRILAS